MSEKRESSKISSGGNWEKVVGRASMETLFQAALIVLLINVYESLNVSLIQIMNTAFRSDLESAIVIIGIIIGLLFVVNLGFSFAEDRTGLNKIMPWLVLDAIVETITLSASIWVFFYALDVNGLLSIALLNPFLLIGSMMVIILLTNLCVARYYAKKQTKYMILRF